MNTETLASEVIDGEAIIMNMATGVYHSATGVGAVIWQALLDGADEDAIAAVLAGAFPTQSLAGDLARFFGELSHAGLIVGSPGNGGTAAIDLDGIDYAAPRLESYGDMQDLIMLDPIHDVSEQHGWPVRPADAARAAEGRR